MGKLYQVLFWVFVGLFAVDIVAPTYTNAENFALMAFLFRIANLVPAPHACARACAKADSTASENVAPSPRSG